jgi:hypothetical protein
MATAVCTNQAGIVGALMLQEKPPGMMITQFVALWLADHKNESSAKTCYEDKCRLESRILPILITLEDLANFGRLFPDAQYQRALFIHAA